MTPLQLNHVSLVIAHIAVPECEERNIESKEKHVNLVVRYHK